MALATYQDLKAAVASELARSDLTTYIPDAITLAHARINRILREHPRMQKRNTAFSINAEYVAVPTDFRELKSMILQTNPPAEISMQYDNWASPAESDQPRYVIITGSTTPGVEFFRFGPVPNAVYTATIEYVAYLTAMSGNTDHNWVLDEHPDVYLYGACLYCAMHLRDDAGTQIYKAAFDMALQELVQAGRRTRAHGPMMRTQPG